MILKNKWLRTLTILWLLSIGYTTRADSQTNLTLPILSTDRIIWDQEGFTTGHRIIVDGISTDLGNLIPSSVNGTISTYKTPVPALTPGNHIIVVIAYNGSGSSLPSAELQLVVSVAVPSAPTNLRLGK